MVPNHVDLVNVESSRANPMIETVEEVPSAG
jgi:hypothetical protein